MRYEDDDSDRARLEHARKVIARDKQREAEEQAAYEDHLRARELDAWFRNATREDVLHMWQHGCSEDGAELTEFEFQALVEAWVRVFNELPPRVMEADYDADSPPPPVPSRTRRKKTKPPPQEAELDRIPDDTMLSQKDVIRITGIPLSSLKRIRKAGDFPQPHQISPRRIGWRASEVRRKVQQMKADRNGCK